MYIYIYMKPYMLVLIHMYTYMNTFMCMQMHAYVLNMYIDRAP